MALVTVAGVLAALALLAPVLIMGVRWNRRHGYHTRSFDPRDEDRMWWMVPERKSAAARVIRREGTAHDPDLARDVCTIARARMILWRNPWFFALGALGMVGFNVFQLTARAFFESDRPSDPAFSLAIAFVVLAAVVAVVLWIRSRVLGRARRAYEAHREMAGEEEDPPLPGVMRGHADR